MADLERAYAVLRFRHGAATIYEIPVDVVEAELPVALALVAAARREGAEEMRERAARLCDREVPWLGIGEDIRALPLEEKNEDLS